LCGNKKRYSFYSLKAYNICMSSSPNFSIPQWVADIALEYSRLACDKNPTVSKGIKRMEQRIKELENDLDFERRD